MEILKFLKTQIQSYYSYSHLKSFNAFPSLENKDWCSPQTLQGLTGLAPTHFSSRVSYETPTILLVLI